ncbi:hypothetical protein WJX73_006793 [Symbiochloris irregularis]|uniref:DUF676 domain-containing protein n=1 Tax=Symbiochloris irregularis TaxID=706552 RepID=A0AAW1NTA3_9CHLO
MVNGLFGSPANWDVLAEKIGNKETLSSFALLAVTTNTRIQTFGGIDIGGDRLVVEIRAYVAEHPPLKRISVLVHSMGGLLARYCIGKLFNPITQRVCGLIPVHFISMATPHLGCDGTGNAQVPFIGWTEGMPLAGSSISWALGSAAAPVASVALGATGAQFFRTDGKASGEQPLLMRLAQDGEEEGTQFWSALAAFCTCTCYANSSGDHLVGWANASFLRADAEGCGIEEPADLRDDGWREQDEACMEEDSTEAEHILKRLQMLRWRRVDVCFRDTRTPFFAHNLIQVTRRWLNWEGESVACHVADQLASIEQLASRYTSP